MLCINNLLLIVIINVLSGGFEGKVKMAQFMFPQGRHHLLLQMSIEMAVYKSLKQRTNNGKP